MMSTLAIQALRLSLSQTQDGPAMRSVAYTSIVVEAGTPLCLRGANGSGKTTLLSYLFGDSRYRASSDSKLTLDATPLDTNSLNLASLGFRLLPQNRPGTGLLTCGDLWTLLTGNTVWRQAEFAGLWAPLRASAKTRVSALSGGQWKLALLFAYLRSPGLTGLVMDEPLAGLPLERQGLLLQAITDEARTRQLKVLLTAVVDEQRPALDRWLQATRFPQVRLALFRSDQERPNEEMSNV